MNSEEWDEVNWETELPDNHGMCDGLGCNSSGSLCFCDELWDFKQAVRKAHKKPWRAFSYPEQRVLDDTFRVLHEQKKKLVEELCAKNKALWQEEITPRRKELSRLKKIYPEEFL